MSERGSRGCPCRGPCGAVEGVRGYLLLAAVDLPFLLRGQCKYNLPVFVGEIQLILQRHKNTSETQRWLTLGYSAYRKLQSPQIPQPAVFLQRCARAILSREAQPHPPTPLPQALKLLSRLPSLPVPAPGSAPSRPCPRPSPALLCKHRVLPPAWSFLSSSSCPSWAGQHHKPRLEKERNQSTNPVSYY